MHKLIVDGNLTLAAQVERAQRPISDDDLTRLTRAAATGAERRAGELARAHNWRQVMIGVGLLVLAIGAGFGGGYWFGYHGAAEAREGLSRAITGAQAAEWRDLIQMNDISAIPRQCGAQQGGEACAFTLWTKLPKATAP